MSTIVTRAGKGAPLTHNEVDANFTNLNTDKYQAGDNPSFGNITVTGTVDGRDVSADGTKLDGIEAGATADQTAAEILTAIKTVDGTGSGLDADTLDGQHASAFLTGNQTITLSGDVSGSGTTSIVVTVADDSHNHIIANVDGLQTALDGKSATTHNHTLDSLSNTTITSNTAGEILKWSGTAWINNTLAEAGIQPAGSYLTGNQTITLTGDVSGSGTTSINVTIADDSHNHVWGNIDGASVNAWGGLRHSTAYGYIDFGPANTSYAHIYTDRPAFYLNKGLIASAGLTVVGTCSATTFTGDGSQLTGIDAGATGGGSDQIFWENGQTVTTNYTITNGKNAMSAGPITINSGVTVTVGAGEVWTVV